MRISDWSSDVCSSDLTTFCTLARVCVSDFVRIPPPAVWPVRKRQEFAGPRWWARLGLNQRPFRCERNALPLSYAPAQEGRFLRSGGGVVNVGSGIDAEQPEQDRKSTRLNSSH